MALGKTRNSKRSSGTSYTSTVTTVVFVSLCVLGVYMLTSSSIVPPQSTSRSATEEASSHATLSKAKKAIPAYEDTPSDLPEDAIKTDEPINKQDQQIAASTEDAATSSIGEDKQETKTETESSEQNNDKEETEQETVTGDDAANNKNDEENEQKESVEEQEKQEEHQTQVSEESSVTLNQQADQTSTLTDNGNKKAHEEINSNESTSEEDHQLQEQPKHEQEQPKEEQQRRKQGKNEEEEEEESEGVTSKDQIEHDEAQVQTSSEDHSSRETTQVTKSQLEDHKPRHGDSKDSGKINQEIKQTGEKPMESSSSFPGGENSGIPTESKESKKSWSTQADQSENQKERRGGSGGASGGSDGQDGSIYGFTWQLCNVTAGTDYIPCLDNEKALKHLHNTGHYEHRERHCPEEPPTCLVSMPEGYRTPVEWPQSRNKVRDCMYVKSFNNPNIVYVL